MQCPVPFKLSGRGWVLCNEIPAFTLSQAHKQTLSRSNHHPGTWDELSKSPPSHSTDTVHLLTYSICNVYYQILYCTDQKQSKCHCLLVNTMCYCSNNSLVKLVLSSFLFAVLCILTFSTIINMVVRWNNALHRNAYEILQHLLEFCS